MTYRKSKGSSVVDKDFVLIGGTTGGIFSILAITGMILEANNGHITRVGPTFLAFGILLLAVPVALYRSRKQLLPSSEALLDGVDAELDAMRDILKSQAFKKDTVAKSTLKLLTQRRNTLLKALQDIYSDERNQVRHDPDQRTSDLYGILVEARTARQALADLREERSLVQDITNTHTQRLEADADTIEQHIRTLKEDVTNTREARAYLTN